MTRHLNEETGNQYFRARMKAAREIDSGFADRDFAARELGMSYNTLMHIERGARPATEGDVYMMVQAYHAPELGIDYLENSPLYRLVEKLTRG